MKREEETGGYPTEIAQYGKIIDYKAWLIAKGGSTDQTREDIA